jgi:hypothetical protein
MKFSAHYAALALTLALATPVLAQDAAPAPVPTFGDVGYGGTGCPDGTATIIASPDRQSASLVLSDYIVGSNGRALDRATCAIAVPVDVPDGMQVAVQFAAVRGHAALPADLEATLSVEAFTAGETGPVKDTVVTGPIDRTLLSLTAIPNAELVWSACGADINLRLNTSLRTRGDQSACACR